MIDPTLIRDPSRYALSRRKVLTGSASGVAALLASSVPLDRAFAKDTLTVADPGGAWAPASAAAFVQPFAKEANVTVKHIAREHYPTVEIKANVETKSYTWDAVIATDADVNELAPQNLLEPLDWSGADMSEIMPEAKRPDWMGTGRLLRRSSPTAPTSTGRTARRAGRDFWTCRNSRVAALCAAARSTRSRRRCSPTACR